MSSLCQNTSLDSPLSVTILLEALDCHLESKRPRNGRVKSIIYDFKEVEKCGIHLSNPFSTFTQHFSSIFHRNSHIDNIPEAVAEWYTLHTSSNTLAAIKSSLLTTQVQDKNFFQNIYIKIPEHPFFPQLLSLYSWRFLFEKLIVATARPKPVSRRLGSTLNPMLNYMNPGEKNPIFSYNLHDDMQFTVSSSFLHIYQRSTDNTWLSSREHLLQLGDICNQRYMTLLTCIVAEMMGDNTTPLPALLLSTFNWGDQLLQKFGNDAYKSIKYWEPLMTAYLITHHEDVNCDTVGFFTTISRDFQDSQGADNMPFMRESLQSLAELVMPYHRSNPHILSQLFGLYRIWGHPTVDGLSGVEKLLQLTRHFRTINQVSVKIITQKWREYFCLSFWSREGRWPSISPETFSEKDTPSYILSCLQNNTPIDKHHTEYHPPDWEKVIFDKTFEVPDKFEFSEMISDKATSLDIPDLRERCINHHDIGPSQDRSVIIRWLRSNYQSPTEFLSLISQRGFLPESGVCGVYPKEREGKNEPRLFGLMSMERRLYIVLTEAMIADFILKYFPEITMTFDQTTLNTRLHHVTKSLSSETKKPSTSIVTNIDFQKWNSYMREEETIGIFTDFDRLFGLKNVFSRSHELFSGCQFYLADGTITPEWEDEITMKEGYGVWRHHLGGIEGLRQKGWTVFTVVMLKYVCELNQITCQLLGQGDNQVLITHYYPHHYRTVAQQHTIFLNRLDQFLRTIGPPLKVEETWSSSHFFTYGKFPILKGVPLSMSLKRISRCGRLNNEGMVSLDSVLSSISANLSAATSLCLNPTILIYPATSESLASIHLYLNTPFFGEILPEFGKRIKVKLPGEKGKQTVVTQEIQPHLSRILKHPWKIAQHIFTIPSSLGGYPIFQISDLLMHGFPDPVSSSIWELKKIYQLIKPGSPLRHTILCVLHPRISGYKNPELLCQDPTCLNLIRGSRPQDQRRRMVFKFLPKIPGIINTTFLQFLDKASQQQDDLAEVLFSMRPLHPRICASIYESTPTGRAQSVVKKIEKTRTLENMLAQDIDKACAEHSIYEMEEMELKATRAPKTLHALANIFEINQVGAILLVINNVNVNRDIVNECSTVLAERWREESWGIHLCGVTVAVPMELMKLEESLDCEENHSNSELGYIRVQTELITPQHAFSYLGPFKPFFGSITTEKVKYEGGKLISQTPPVLRIALKNLRLINWGTSEDSNLANLLTSVFSTLTDLPWQNLIPQVGGASGTLEHRWADSRTEHGVSPSITYSVSTHFTVNTNKFKPELKVDNETVDNVNVNMQSIFSLICIKNLYLCLIKDHLPKTSHWHVGCTKCISFINEDQIDIPDSELYNSLLAEWKEEKPVEATWVEKDRFLLQELPPIEYHCTHTDDFKGNWEDILTLTVVDWIIKEHPISVDPSLTWCFDESVDIIPIAIVAKCRAEKIFPVLSHFMVLHVIYLRAKYWVERSDNPTIHKMLQSEISRLTNLRLNWYKPLISLFLSEDIYQYIVDKTPGTSLPKGCPPTLEERSQCIKHVVEECFAKISSDSLIQLIKHVLSKSIIVTTLSCMHPEVLTILQHWLNQQSCQGPAGFLLGEMRTQDRSTSFQFNSQLSRISQLDTSLLAYPTISGKTLSTNVKLINTTMDYAAKKVSGRIHPKDQVSLTSKIEPITQSDLEKLPLSCQWVKFNPLLVAGVAVCDQEGLDFPVSSINHLYKFPLIVTTAPYKLLSIIKSLYVMKQLPLPSKSTILSCGDGTGGFTALLGQLFPQSKIVYNSLYFIKNQSSVGCDRFIPAGVVGHRVNLNNIEGIEEVVERESDLTKLAFIDQVSRAHPNLGMICCDAEGGTSRDPSKLITITENLILLARNVSCRIIIIKTYASRLDMVLSQASLLKTSFRQVNCVRSQFSGYGNTEIYLTAFGLIKNPQNMRVEIGPKFTKLRGQVPVQEELEGLKVQITTLPYQAICNKKMNAYTAVLSKGGSIPSLSTSWATLVDQLSTLDNLQFPISLLTLIREEYALVKFKPMSKSYLRKHLLSIPIAQKLLMTYLVWIFYSLSDKDILRFERNHKDLSFVVYETITGKWSFNLSSSSHTDWGKKFKIWKLTDLIDPDFQRLTYSLLRDIRHYLGERKLQWSYCGADQFPHRVKLVTEFKDWKARIGTECGPLSLCTGQKEGQKLYIPASIRIASPEEKISDESMSILKILQEEGLLSCEDEKVAKWIKGVVIYSPRLTNSLAKFHFLQCTRNKT